MSRHRRFIDRVLAGEILDPSTEIDNAVEAWHSSDSDVSLGDWLGMTLDEYTLYVERASSLSAILQARKYGLDLHTFLAETENATAMAARGVSAEEAQVLLQWLRETGRIRP